MKLSSRTTALLAGMATALTLGGTVAAYAPPLVTSAIVSASQPASVALPTPDAASALEEAWRLYQSQWTDGCRQDFDATYKGAALVGATHGGGEYLESELYPGTVYVIGEYSELC